MKTTAGQIKYPLLRVLETVLDARESKRPIDLRIDGFARAILQREEELNAAKASDSQLAYWFSMEKASALPAKYFLQAEAYACMVQCMTVEKLLKLFFTYAVSDSAYEAILAFYAHVPLYLIEIGYVDDATGEVKVVSLAEKSRLDRMMFSKLADALCKAEPGCWRRRNLIDDLLHYTH